MGDIFTLGKQCYQDFQDVIDNLGQAAADHLIQLPLTSIESQFGKFRVWCGNLGALQSGFSSLDYRLREATIMHMNVTELLRQLDSALFECMSPQSPSQFQKFQQALGNAVITGRRPPFENQCPPSDSSEYSTDESEDEDEAASAKELVMRLSSIKDILSDLYRLGHKIRDPKLRPTSNRAILLEAKDPDTDVDLFSQFAKLDEAHVREVLNGLRQATGDPQGDCDSSYLSQRLAAAITLRRKYFAYWERHAKKLAQNHVDSTSRGPQPPRAANLQATTQSRTEPVDEELTREQQPRADPAREGGGTVLTKTDATPYDARRDEETERGTIVSFASTALDVDGKGVELPGPPAGALLGESFTCPYCFVLCPAKQGRGKVWKAHVLHDLQPYVCTYKECSNSNELYRSRRQWLKHENSVHRRTWHCNEHPQAIFSAADGLKDHLSHEHENLADAEIEELLSILAISHADDRDHCPVCLQKPPFQKGLTNHIANHMERIALFALPKDHHDDEANSAVAVAPGDSITPSQASTDAMSGSNLPARPDTPKSETVNEITEQLLDKMKLFRGRNGIRGEQPHYLPRSVAEEFWDDARLRSILEAYLSEQEFDLSIIKNTCLLAFSLLILVERGYLLPLFLDTHSTLLRDQDFPLLDFPPLWPDTSQTRRLFYYFSESQWVVFPIVFNPETLANQLLDPACILPIHDEEVMGLDDFITVTKIRTNAEFTTPRETILLRKTYTEEFQCQYDRERRAFESLRGVDAANIVRYYGSYRQIQGGTDKITYNILLEHVPGGDLGSLLQSMRPPQTFAQVCDLWVAFVGVLDGLSKLHRYRSSASRPLVDELGQQLEGQRYEGPSKQNQPQSGFFLRRARARARSDRDHVDFQRIHQDITPENLLVSRKHSNQPYPFELKITDLGFTYTKIKDPTQDSHQLHNSAAVDFHGDLVYGAPERSYHDRKPRQGLEEMTTAADIWSLGCVISETAAWVALGENARAEYWQTRVDEQEEPKPIYKGGPGGCFHDGHEALKAVSKQHEIITRSVARFDNVTPRVIQMVEDHMLCRKELRYTAFGLRNTLASIIQTVKEESRASGPLLDRQSSHQDQEPVARSLREASGPTADGDPTRSPDAPRPF
ncbi:hypothetical protein ACJ41O_010360 [Fusarium nematophilum]